MRTSADAVVANSALLAINASLPCRRQQPPPAAVQQLHGDPEYVERRHEVLQPVAKCLAALILCKGADQGQRSIPTAVPEPIEDAIVHSLGEEYMIDMDVTDLMHHDDDEVCGGHLGRTETQRGRLWTACGQRCVDSKNSQTTPTTTSTSSIRQLLGAADAQTAHPATSSTAPAHQTTGLRERGNDTSRSTGRSGRQNAAPRRNMRREERVTVQGPVKEHQPDGMSHRGGGGRGACGAFVVHLLFERLGLWCSGPRLREVGDVSETSHRRCSPVERDGFGEPELQCHRW